MSTQPTIQLIGLEFIVADVQVRPIDQAHVAKLAASMKEHGQLVPIVVHEPSVKTGNNMDRFLYRLGPGRHRLEAARKLGWSNIAAIVKPAATDQELRAEQVRENLERKDLTPLEEAELCEALLTELKGNVREAAAVMGRSPVWVENRAALTRLSAQVRKWVVDGSLPLAHARVIARLPNTEDQEDIADTMRGKDGDPAESLYRVEGAVEQRGADLSRVTWELGVAFGAADRACATCPFNGANTRGLFDDPKEAKQACLDLSCFKDKTTLTGRAARKCANWIAKEGVAATPANAKKAREAREVPYVTVAAVSGAVEQAKKDAKFKAQLPKNEDGKPITVKRDTPQAQLERALDDWANGLGHALCKTLERKPLAAALVELIKLTPGGGYHAKPKDVQALLPFVRKASKVDGATLLEVAKLVDAGNIWVDELADELTEALAVALDVKFKPKPTLEQIKSELAKKAEAEKKFVAKKPVKASPKKKAA